MAPERSLGVVEVSFDDLERRRLSLERIEELTALATARASLRVGRSTIEIRCSEAATAAAFAARYEDLPSAAPPDFHAFCVETGGAAYFWAEDGRRVWSWPRGPLPAEIAAFFLDNATMYEFLCRTSYLGFHAAVVAGASLAAALVGETTAGKTTTAIACVRRGMRLYSDERCILEDGLVVPFLRRLTLRKGGREVLLADGPVADALDLRERLLSWREARDVTLAPSSLAGGLAGGPALPLGAVFVIEGRGSVPELHPSSPSEALPALLAAMASREGGLDRVARVLHELRDARVYRLRLGAPDATAGIIERELSAVECDRLA